MFDLETNSPGPRRGSGRSANSSASGPVRKEKCETCSRKGTTVAKPVLRFVDGRRVGTEQVGAIRAIDSGAPSLDGSVVDIVEFLAVEPVESARLYQEEHRLRLEAEERCRIAEGLRRILAAVGGSRLLPDTLTDVAAQAADLLGADLVAIRCRPSGQGLGAVYASSGSRGDPCYIADLPSGSGLLVPGAFDNGPVVLTGVVDLAADRHDLSNHPQPSNGTWQALLGVPISVGGALRGGLELYYRQPREISRNEVRLAQTVSDQIALAIEGADLREKAEEAAAAAERNRIARDLHDAVTQTLFSASLIAEVLPQLWQWTPEEGIKRLDDLRQLTRGALAEMRTLLLELRPATLTEAHLGELLKQLVEASVGRSRLPISIEVDGERELPPAVQIALFRIAQEALNNVVKHSGAKRAWVHLRAEAGLVELSVTDDGRGFDLSRAPADHLGLEIMRERTESIGGEIAVESQLGRGTRVHVKWRDPKEGVAR